MNTKLQFYCINIDHHSFTKIVFEVILPGDCIEDRSDAVEWVDNSISKHYNDFGLDVVLDWVVLSYEQTDELIKDTEIIETIDGKLIFKDDIDFHYCELGKLTSEKNKLNDEIMAIKKDLKKSKSKKEVKERKTYPSVWLEPGGEVHELGFAQHEEFASNWLNKNEPEIFESRYGFNGESKYRKKYSHEILQDLGWIRILGWTDPPNFVITCRVTPNQRNSLKDYCLSTGIPYSAFPDILKSQVKVI